MKIYNTLTRTQEEFVPVIEGKVGLYTCGPTVYDYAHIGNFRAYVFEDLLRRHLRAEGYEVTQVMNITDIDDKTISGANEQGVALNDYTRPYTEAFFEDLDVLNIERAEEYPAATEHIQEMIDLVKRLVDTGVGYVSEDGSVYFSVSRFSGYGKLAHLDMSGLRAGARVAQDEYDKENVGDFALWKAWSEEDGPVSWESPWGKGRPGWHIECSAMSMKYLGESFDLHTGGIDNMFPHHENEIAQSEAATGKKFVNYWMHNAHLQVNGKKMSKSLGNFYTLRDIIKQGYTGREVRYVLISGHYRQTLNFTFDALGAAKASLARLDDFRDRLASMASEGMGALPEWASEGKRAFDAAMADDLNTPEALSALFDMVHAGNRAIDEGNVDGAAAGVVLLLWEKIDNVLGVLSKPEEKPDDSVMNLVQQRQSAREKKDWAESDRLRDEILSLGWIVKDAPDGQQLKRK